LSSKFLPVIGISCFTDLFTLRIQAQFDHLADAYFGGFDTDLAERELGYVTSLDHDLDMFAASISLAKTSVAGLIKEEGTYPSGGQCISDVALLDIVLDMGGYNIEQELFEPLNTLLNRCKSAKTLSRFQIFFNCATLLKN
jgi:dynactin 1